MWLQNRLHSTLLLRKKKKLFLEKSCFEVFSVKGDPKWTQKEVFQVLSKTNAWRVFLENLCFEVLGVKKTQNGAFKILQKSILIF